MNISIDAANSGAALCDASHVRQEVFGKQCYRRLPRLDDYDPTQILTLVARLGDTNEPIGALGVVETTGDGTLHSAFNLSFPFGSRVARFTQLAVFRAYRGLRLPAHMISEARRGFLLPKQILYTWLLFNAKTAKSSSLCRELGFKCCEKEFTTEYGRSRVLLRKEKNEAQEFAGRPTLESAPASMWNGTKNGHAGRQLYIFPQTIAEDEWLSQ